MSDGLRERLIAATAKWRKLDSERDAARDEILDAAAEMLKNGASPAEVVGLTPFSDALVRRETRDRGAPKGMRGPKRKGEAKRPGVSIEPVPKQPLSLAASPFLSPAAASESVEERERLQMKALRNNQARWFKTAWQATDGLKGRERTQKILAMAVEAGHLEA